MTNFEQYKENLTVEQLAQSMVKLCIVNSSTPYYVTSTGQLFPMSDEGFDAAVEYERRFWSMEAEPDSVNEGEANEQNKGIEPKTLNKGDNIVK